MALPLLKNETLAIAGLSHYNRNAFTVLSHYITDLLKKQRKGNILHTGYFKHINNCNCDHVFWAVKLCKIVCVIHTTQNKKLKKKKNPIFHPTHAFMNMTLNYNFKGDCETWVLLFTILIHKSIGTNYNLPLHGLVKI